MLVWWGKDQLYQDISPHIPSLEHTRSTPGSPGRAIPELYKRSSHDPSYPNPHETSIPAQPFNKSLPMPAKPFSELTVLSHNSPSMQHLAGPGLRSHQVTALITRGSGFQRDPQLPQH